MLYDINRTKLSFYNRPHAHKQMIEMHILTHAGQLGRKQKNNSLPASGLLHEHIRKQSFFK